MDRAIEKYFKRSIQKRVRLTGGYTFNTWLLFLDDGQKLVFRSSPDMETSSGRKIQTIDVFEREKFFYDHVNQKLGRTCPHVYVIDGSGTYYNDPFQLSEYMEGTPLNLCYDRFDESTQNDLQFTLGKIAGHINSLELDEQHPYITSRGAWDEYLSVRLYQRLIPLVKNDLITPLEIKSITDGFLNQKFTKSLSFLHLDMRRVNMIYDNGRLYLLDAENSDFGDPLYELAGMEVGDGLTASFLDGYKSAFKEKFDLESDLFFYYKMERQALVLDLFMNVVKHDANATQYYLAKFIETKRRIL